VTRSMTVIAWLLLLTVPTFAQKHHDPLNQLEIDQLRDTAQEPVERLKLYVEFVRARLQALDKARSDPKVSDRGQETHDRLQQFLDVFDELNDNIDTFADRKEDLRKALKAVIEGDSEFQAKLRALKDAAGTTPQETKAYDFLLTNAIQTVDSSIADHRQLLEEQEETAKHKKKK
jgi:hypothetical protein